MGALKEALGDLRCGDPERYIFLSHESCRTDNNLRKRHLRPAAERLNIYCEGFGFHALRREAITELAKLMGATQTMKMAGHSKMAMMQLYTLYDSVAQAEGAESYAKRILQREEWWALENSNL